MIILPEEEGERVDSQVYQLIGEALRASVADAAPSPAFQARLAQALDQAAKADGAALATP